MTTLERAARALALAYYQEECDDSPGEFQKNFSQLSPEDAADRYWEGWVNQARAVLMAVRSADTTTIQAGAYAYDDERAIKPVWEAMIDAILADGGG